MASVPGPPAPPAITAAPEDVARARQLQAQIAAQSAAADVLAERYNKARDNAAIALRQLNAVQADLLASQPDVSAAEKAATDAQASLKEVALHHYLSMSSLQSPGGPLTQEQRRQVSAYQQGATGSLTASVRRLRVAQSRLQGLTGGLMSRTSQAAAYGTALQAAQDAAASAAQAVDQQQSQLVGTMAQVKGNMVGLVAALQAQASSHAYASFSLTNPLDFHPGDPLPTVLPQASAALQLALAQQGKPYVWGGTGPNVFDCSGLIQWTWTQLGVRLPRVAADQQAWAVPVPISQLQPGDLVFFGTPAHHMGMYAGNGMMVDAPHTGAVVEVVPIWWNELAGFGRVHY